MIDNGSTDTTSPAFAQIMPPRTPIASFCKTLGCCHHFRLLNAGCRRVLGSPPTHIGHPVATLFVIGLGQLSAPYRELAIKATNAQAETAAALGQLQARLAVVEKILKDVE